MSKNINKLLLLLLFIMLIQWSCAPTKNTFFRRNYHNVTSHYNAYFNGNESLKEGIAQLEKAHIDDYTGILEIYKYGDETQSQSVFPQMDRSLIKASKVIKKHSMEFKGIEYCEWIDDSYLMIGKAYFFKQDYRLANKTFDFVLRKYGKSEIKAEALLWMIKTNNRKEDYASSSSLIGMLKNEIEQGNAYKKTIKEYPMLCADYYIKTEDYTAAIKSLEEAIKLNKKKKTKTRLLFILGQVYQETEELQKASDIYKKVVKLNPEYDMAFHAKINMAKCFDAESGDSKTIRKELHKMIKDTKNKDYLDEIYYALAEISIKEEKEEEAIDFLRLSTRKSLNNNKQKGMSYLNLGEIFYSRLEYEYAQMYYDSCVLFLPEEYENYAQIKSKQEILSNLVLNLNTIELEDSLQYLAGLTDAEQNKIIDEIIQKLIEEEERKKQEELNNYMNLQNVQTNTQGLGGNQWYFYNTSAMSFGLTEFVKKWGQRKLEDMWRISEKQSAGFGDDNFGDEVVEGDTSGVDTNRVSTDPKDRKTYKQNIPKTEEDIDASNIKIVDAYYAVGIIYKDKLKDLEKSIETFEALLKRFPENKYQLETYYQLYRVFLDLDYVDKREKHKALILNNYPNSDYAKLILDPDYYKNQEKELDLAEEQYKITYNLYQQESYKEVILQSDKAIIDFHTTDTEAKFAYIRALSIGKTTGADSLVAELEIVVKNYGGTEIAVEAQTIIDFYKKSTTAENDQASDDNEADKQTYSFNPNEMHIFVMVLYVEGIKVSDIKVIFSDHNKKYFQITKLTTSSLYLDNTRQMITVSKFENQEAGIKYYKTISQNELLLKSISTAKAKYFIISTTNYKLLYQKKDVEEYEEFFNKNYM